MSLSSLIEFSDATVGGSGRFLDSARIERITWSVQSGEFWVVGARPRVGKTDLLATAAGLQRPIAGECRLFGSRLEDLSDSERLAHRLRVGIVFENGGRLFSELTVEENLALPVCYHRDCSAAEAADLVARVLELTGLTRVGQLKPAHVSHPLHQRIALARALILNPDVLLIDSPLFNSDPRQTGWWLDFLPSLAAGHPLLEGRGLTLVVTTTDFRPWLASNRSFAIIHRQRWEVLGGLPQLEQTDHPLARSMLTGCWNDSDEADFI